MKKLTVSLLALTVLTGGAFAQLSVGFNAGFTGDMYGLSSDFYDQNKGALTEELAPMTGFEVTYEPNSATVGFDFGLNATYDMGFFFVRADFRRETLVSGGENSYSMTGPFFGASGDFNNYTLTKDQTTSGAITSIPVYLGVNIPVMKGKIFAGLGYGYYMADANLTLDIGGSYIDAMDIQLATADASLQAFGLAGLSSTKVDRQGTLEYSTTGTGVEYLLGYQSKISDNLSLSFTYSAGGGVVYGESEFNTYQISPDATQDAAVTGAYNAGQLTDEQYDALHDLLANGVTTTDYQLAEGFDELSSQFLYTEVGDGTKTKTMFPLKTAGSKIMLGVQYNF